MVIVRLAKQVSARNAPSIALLFATILSLPVAQARAIDRNWSEDGEASFYGNHWVGHRTTSGARFDQNKMTCAHPDLPLGTKLLVTADDSGDSVVVTVNDRQPYHGNRIIDLSRAAARRLHMLGSGVAEVTISPATAIDIRTHDAEQDGEVAAAPDITDDQDVATPEPSTPRHAVRHHGRRHLRQ